LRFRHLRRLRPFLRGGSPSFLPLVIHEIGPERALRPVLVVGTASQSHLRHRCRASARHLIDVIKLLWNDLSSRHVLSFFAHLGSCLLFDEELKTTDEAGRFDDESLCYSRVTPVARHLAA
jgi:hypothetical protein